MEEVEENLVHTVESPKSPTVLPWDKFSNWLHCACVVTFDLELGQAMEVNTVKRNRGSFFGFYKFRKCQQDLFFLLQWSRARAAWKSIN